MRAFDLDLLPDILVASLEITIFLSQWHDKDFVTNFWLSVVFSMVIRRKRLGPLSSKTMGF